MSEVFGGTAGSPDGRPRGTQPGPGSGGGAADDRPRRLGRCRVRHSRPGPVSRSRLPRLHERRPRSGSSSGTSLKNVIALAAGIAIGMGLGANAHGALLTRGLAEMMRLGRRDRREAGDLSWPGRRGGSRDDLLVAAEPQPDASASRSAAASRWQEALASMTQVAEGVPTTRSAVGLARRHADRDADH